MSDGYILDMVHIKSAVYSDYEDTSDDEDSDDEDCGHGDEVKTVDLPIIECVKDLTPEQKKQKEREDYDKQMKEGREKNHMDVWNEMLHCSWAQLRAYRTQLGLDNEGFEWVDTF